MANLKNYTTTIPASRSIGEIQEILLQFGAQSIQLNAVNKRVTDIKFLFRLGDKLLPFRLPINIEKAVDFLWNQYRKKSSRGRKERDDFYDEAERISWRIGRDWIHAQVSLLAIEAVELIDVFAGYLMTNTETGETFADQIKAGAFDKMLPKHEG
ncbi:MAG TPA: hypothetical protein ENH82_18510 [bacterium]|nr:hypothetical protein [bacterium]